MPLGPLSGRTAVYGIVGYPVTHTLSPAIQNAAFQRAGIDACYVAFPVAPGGLEAALAGARALGVRGLNVTVPHKEGALAWALANGAEATPTVRAIGAINTLHFTDHGVRVANTDAPGFLRALWDLDLEPSPGLEAVLLGAGGAARAAAWTLFAAGCRVTILNRTEARADALRTALRAAVDDADAHRRLEVRPWSSVRPAIERADLIVNTTPVGMAPNVAETPVNLSGCVRSGQVVFDMLYRPAETRFLRTAHEAGARTANGLGMLIYQGAEAFYFWTGQHPDDSAMWAAARAELAADEAAR